MSERVVVCVDFKNPHALLAVAPTRALEARLAARFDWRPLVLAPLSPPKPIGVGDDRGARHRSIRAAYLERDLERYASARGLELRDLYRSPDGALASLGLLWLRQEAPELAGDYVTRIFELVWQRGADVASAAVVESALGGDPRAFRAWAEREGARELAANQRELAEAGAWNVPAYLLHGEVFIGRQHLPMVEWLLSGQTGAPPI
jgi:2-hydroxychromene-2-carboxylate isomerase